MDETEQTAQTPERGPGGVPKDAKTSDYYRTGDIPPRFDNPGWFQGYERKPQHPMYMTSSSEYGRCCPTVHTMPTSFHAKSQQFSQVEKADGMTLDDRVYLFSFVRYHILFHIWECVECTGITL